MTTYINLHRVESIEVSPVCDTTTRLYREIHIDGIDDKVVITVYSDKRENLLINNLC